MTTITLEDVIRVASELPKNAQNPGECVYTDRTGRHCIAGEIIVRLGGRVPRGDAPENKRPLAWLLEYGFNFGVRFDTRAEQCLSKMQRKADNKGMPWGEAIFYATGVRP